MLVSGEHRPLLEFDPIEGGLHGPHRRNRNVASQQSDPVCGWLFAESFPQGLEELLAIPSRSSKDEKRAASAGRSMRWTSARKNFSFAQAIATWPSAVAKNWKGTMLGWPESAVRSPGTLAVRYQVAR